MLRIYMLRCSPFMQVKCNLYRMGAIALTVKRNDCLKLILSFGSITCDFMLYSKGLEDNICCDVFLRSLTLRNKVSYVR